MEKEELIFYFLNFNANFAATAHERTVIPIGKTPLVSICGTCSMAMLPEEYIAAATGKATSPITPSFVFVFSEMFSCMLYVLIVIVLYNVSVVLRMDRTFFNDFVQLLSVVVHRTVQFLNSCA